MSSQIAYSRVFLRFALGFCENIKKMTETLYQSFSHFMAPQVGLEPTTPRLTAECSAIELLRNIESGDDLSSRAVTSQVLSALRSLTSVFGMGTGGTLSPLSPEIQVPFVPSKPHTGMLQSIFEISLAFRPA